MTFDAHTPYSEAYVWVWLPNAKEPVVAGLLTQQGPQLVFNYGRSYLARPDAISLYAPELPLQPGGISLIPGLNMPSCLRDASPDAWGRRVLIHQKLGVNGTDAAQIAMQEEVVTDYNASQDKIQLILDVPTRPVPSGLHDAVLPAGGP
jgi:serine/threonine-protein kinase HipA